MATIAAALAAATLSGPAQGDDLTNEPGSGYNFSLHIGGEEAGRFVEASGLGASVDIIEYREGGVSSQLELPGQVTYQPLVLRYGVSTSTALWNWFEASLHGEPDLRSVTLVMYENDGLTEAVRWTMADAWVSSMHVSRLTDTTNGSIAIESVTIVYDSLERD